MYKRNSLQKRTIVSDVQLLDVYTFHLLPFPFLAVNSNELEPNWRLCRLWGMESWSLLSGSPFWISSCILKYVFEEVIISSEESCTVVRKPVLVAEYSSSDATTQWVNWCHNTVRHGVDVFGMEIPPPARCDSLLHRVGILREVCVCPSNTRPGSGITTVGEPLWVWRNSSFLTLVKLRQNKVNFEMSCLFDITERSVTNVIVTWVTSWLSAGTKLTGEHFVTLCKFTRPQISVPNSPWPG